MATTVTPDPNNPDDQTINQDPDNPTPDSSLPTDPPTDDKPDPTAEELKKLKEKEDFYLNAFREQQQAISKANRELEEARTKLAEKEKPPVVDPGSDEYFQNPAAHTRKLIREELETTIAPLLDFVKGARAGNEYTTLKDKFKKNPAFATVLSNPQIEQYVDQIMSSSEKNESNMQAAILAAAGAHSMGMFGPPPVNNNPAPTNTPVSTPNTPPNVRPSPPAAPTNNNNKPKQRALNEYEKRVCKEQFGGDEAKYIEWADMPASSVVGDVKD